MTEFNVRKLGKNIIIFKSGMCFICICISWNRVEKRREGDDGSGKNIRKCKSHVVNSIAINSNYQHMVLIQSSEGQERTGQGGVEIREEEIGEERKEGK